MLQFPHDDMRQELTSSIAAMDCMDKAMPMKGKYNAAGLCAAWKSALRKVRGMGSIFTVDFATPRLILSWNTSSWLKRQVMICSQQLSICSCKIETQAATENRFLF